jgi:hypothetical protein
MKNDKFILGVDGNPVECDNIGLWGKWFESADRSLKRTDVRDMTVSTVFLGLNHNFGIGGDPVLWETMIFTKGGKDWKDYMERYTSKADALEGHERAVKFVEESSDVSD